MTRSLDELYAPKAMSLDELFAAIRPAPLKPGTYPPSDNGGFTPADFAAMNAPQPIAPDRLWAGVQPGPLNGFNYAGHSGFAGPGGPDSRGAMNDAVASIHNDDLLDQTLARQAAGRMGGGSSNNALTTIHADDLLNQILARQAAGVQRIPIAQMDHPNLAPDRFREQWSPTFHQSAGIPQLQSIAASPQTTTGANPSSSRLKFWPVPDSGTLNLGNRATDEGIGTFGARRDQGRTHQGIDIQAPEGTPVVAAADGRVVAVSPSPSPDFGNQVVIDHGNGIFTQSAHLNMLGVRPGDMVSGGQIIGLSGRTGKVPSGAHAHVHYEVRLGSKLPVSQGGRVDDPLRYLPQPPSKITP
jgi:murein DD-endopeptidase MepM/ murein hydrolase activator NlpD